MKSVTFFSFLFFFFFLKIVKVVTVNGERKFKRANFWMDMVAKIKKEYMENVLCSFVAFNPEQFA
jgi:hypothetical protein